MFGNKFAIIYSVCLLFGLLPCQSQDSKPIFINIMALCNWQCLFSFNQACGSTRNSRLSKGHGFEIMQSVRSKLVIKSYTIENEMMCVADCGLDCDCFMTTYSPKKCEFYKKEAQDYLNKTLTDTLNIYYKVDMLNLPLYLVNGK